MSLFIFRTTNFPITKSYIASQHIYSDQVRTLAKATPPHPNLETSPQQVLVVHTLIMLYEYQIIFHTILNLFAIDIIL